MSVVRYVPGLFGSPAHMNINAALENYKRDFPVIKRLIELGAAKEENLPKITYMGKEIIVDKIPTYGLPHFRYE